MNNEWDKITAVQFDKKYEQIIWREKIIALIER